MVAAEGVGIYVNDTPSIGLHGHGLDGRVCVLSSADTVRVWLIGALRNASGQCREGRNPIEWMHISKTMKEPKEWG